MGGVLRRWRGVLRRTPSIFEESPDLRRTLRHLRRTLRHLRRTRPIFDLPSRRSNNPLSSIFGAEDRRTPIFNLRSSKPKIEEPLHLRSPASKNGSNIGRKTGKAEGGGRATSSKIGEGSLKIGGSSDRSSILKIGPKMEIPLLLRSMLLTSESSPISVYKINHDADGDLRTTLRLRRSKMEGSSIFGVEERTWGFFDFRREISKLEDGSFDEYSVPKTVDGEVLRSFGCEDGRTLPLSTIFEAEDRRTPHLQSSIFGFEDRRTPHLRSSAPKSGVEDRTRDGEGGTNATSSKMRGFFEDSSSIFRVRRNNNPSILDFRGRKNEENPLLLPTFCSTNGHKLLSAI